ncbi:diaminopimelate decarboxylase, aspartate kinase (fusion of lysA and lysC) [Legionella wadsworthii]|uniref:Diaminopimelate decarboxylase n=1 Tax=Legionella wadsworthii TaxID=28088 RepID=A0A378LT05_9GAMM|nr:diaminopimelate decarboxylase, aspartate kinase (fusion of lysA and lysC) [Legionella wadsworthii]
MSNNYRITHALISCLQQKSHKDIQLNQSEVYNILKELYELYTLENKTDQFFEALEQLCTIRDDYLIGHCAVLDNFIVQIEKVYHPQKKENSVIHHKPWWEIERRRLLAIAENHSPCYVYHGPTQQSQAEHLLNLKSIDQLFFAMKANPHPLILKALEKKGIGFECVSLQELKRIIGLFPHLDKHRMLFTPNFASKTEYQFALDVGCYVTIDNVYPLLSWPELFKNKEIIVRIDPGAGAGHHKHVVTGGNESKFGIAQEDIDHLRVVCDEKNIKIIGLHAHSGSGILTPELWEQTAILLTSLIKKFPHIQLINLGGGLGIVEKQGQIPLDLHQLDNKLLAVKTQFPDLVFWMEPGRFLVAESGVLLAKVTQLKEKGDVTFIGVETGMNSLIRPALYGAYHDIANLSQLYSKKFQFSHVVGPICESGDTLGYDRHLPKTQEGDVLLIANVGAYGHCMSSQYNLRPPAQEIFLEE